MRSGYAAGVADVNGNVGLRAAEINCHADGSFRVGDALHLMSDVLCAPFKFALELRDESVAVPAIQIRERAAGDNRNAG